MAQDTRMGPQQLHVQNSGLYIKPHKEKVIVGCCHGHPELPNGQNDVVSTLNQR